ncbi:MAG: DNA alkylation repair protein [Marinilabiliales bacterium]|nr:DNA alkylation repair protein [Marinilabiliales bacterium]
MEETFIACMWSEKQAGKFVPEDFKVLEGWVHNYVNNWASCDTLCNHTVGDFIQKYPGYISELKRWARSENRWVKRASAVSLILPARRGKFLDDIFEIAGILLPDRDDMVQKGYGWMLKEASKPYQKEVFDFVMMHKSVMPRTALRYAIEKMPPGSAGRWRWLNSVLRPRHFVGFWPAVHLKAPHFVYGVLTLRVSI